MLHKERAACAFPRWAERLVLGDPPLDPHWRRNLEAIHDGRRLLVLGAHLPPGTVTRPPSHAPSESGCEAIAAVQSCDMSIVGRYSVKPVA